MQGTILDTGDAAMKKTDQNPCLLRVWIKLGGGRQQSKYLSKMHSMVGDHKYREKTGMRANSVKGKCGWFQF